MLQGAATDDCDLEVGLNWAERFAQKGNALAVIIYCCCC